MALVEEGTLSQYYAGETRENHKKLWSGQLVLTDSNQMLCN